ncbi:MAG: sugar phosphate isomerase/epimerase [Caldilineaceae bacterium]|nr:sugar phosphate isomerase/epimerase [Caldilineaceae bacterium]
MHLGVMNDPRRPLLEEIEWIAANGFDYIDLTLEPPGAALENTEWRSIRSAIEQAGLGVICHAAPYLPIESPSPLVRQAALDELRRSIDAAHILGAPLCTIHFRGWPAHLTDAAGYDYYRQMVEILLRHGAGRDVAIALENSAENHHQLKYFREIFHRLPELKLLFDIGHGNIKTAKSMTRDYLFAFSDRLAHVHISDNGGQADDHLPIGAPARGGIDLAHELRGLRSFSYEGGITVEVFGDRRWLVASAELIREVWEVAS